MSIHKNHGRRPGGLAVFLARSVAPVALAGAASLGGCGGGSSSPASGLMSPANGVAMVTLTDTPGDFLSYIVNVGSLKLTRADGTAVETLPASARVDFAQLLDLSEVVSARQVPAGVYTGVSMTVDYNGASIVVDNGGMGLSVPAGNIMNGSTNVPLTGSTSQLTLTLKLASDAPLVISDRTVANLSLDFNLSASNTVTPSPILSSSAASTVMVTVHPMLSASLTSDPTKQIRVRGKLVSVDASKSTYTVNVRPFHDAMDDDHGQVVVHTTATTSFTLSGTSYTGSAGLTALSALPAGTLTAATGTFDTKTGSFTATAVFAGTSVPGAGLDSVEGTVTARSGNGDCVMTTCILTVSHGWTDERDLDAEEFNPKIMVAIASTTTVTKDGQTGSFIPQDISVGQHLQVFGTFGTDSSGNRTLDASKGSARLMLTLLWGEFISSTTDTITVNLQSLDRLPPSAFNFAGTGTSAANDATASAYQVKVPPGLPVPSLKAGSLIPFPGFVTPFGSAPPDFTAFVPAELLPPNALLLLAWAPPGVTAPFDAPLTETHVVIPQSALQGAQVHVIRIGPEQLDPTAVSSGLTFVPSTSASAMTFAIAHVDTQTIDSFTSFSAFVTALNGDLVGLTAVRAIAAEGTYNQTTGVLTVSRMLVALSGH